MSQFELFGYKACSTCRKAQKWLESHSLPHDMHPIRETPPSVEQLRHALQHGVNNQRKKLCNTSGGDYRGGDLKDRVDAMDEDDFLQELAANGNLIKRPVLITKQGALVGFKEEVWSDFFGQ